MSENVPGRGGARKIESAAKGLKVATHAPRKPKNYFKLFFNYFLQSKITAKRCCSTYS